MHVVHVIASLANDSGGPSRSVPQLIRHLNDNDLSVSLCYPNNGLQLVELPSNCNLIELPLVGWRDLTGIRNNQQQAFAKIHEDNPIDLFHFHGLWDLYTNSAAWFARRKKINYIWTPRGMLEPWSLQQKWFKKKIAWSTYQKSNLQSAIALHATADLEAQNLDRLGLKVPIIVIPNGIPAVPDVDYSKRETSPRIALFLSRIHPKKGIELLIEAWQKLQPTDWKCQIIGPGDPDYIAQLRAKIATADLAKRFEILPPLNDDEKWRAYERASLFVLPTFSENFGIVVAEALAMRLPVVTTTGTPWSMLPSKDCGWYVQPRMNDLAGALQTAFSKSEQQLKRMGDNGHQFAISDFGWNQIGMKFLDRYREIHDRGHLSV